MDDRVLETMVPYMKDSFGNANGKYSIGYEDRKAVNEARKQAAAMLGAEPDEIYFTSGGTEGNNTVIRGFLRNAMLGNDGTVCSSDYNSRIIISDEFEHDSVLQTLKDVEKNDVKTVMLKPDRAGNISPKDLEKVLQTQKKKQNKKLQKML